MAKDNRRIITWSLNAGTAAYTDDLEKYSHKIYSIGLHEFGVNSTGKIYDYRSEKEYFDAEGNFIGQRFPIVIENDMINYPSIKWFLQMIIFGWETNKPFLDNNIRNNENRYPQDQFVHELKKILEMYKGSRNSGTPLNIAGIEIDAESSMTEDYVSMGHDEKYVKFLEKVKNEVIIPLNLKLRVNAHAMWGYQTPFYYRFHNYEMFANSADMNGNATIDEIQLMTYDFAWNGSSAGASTPIWWFRDVGEWCLDNFDPKRNPKAKLTIENLYFGAAGYGHRWGMHDQEAVKSGSTITFRNLLGWMNGQYKHYHTDSREEGWTNAETGETYLTNDGEIDKTRYVYNDQEYLYQSSFQDDESKNEVMYPHVYDLFKPKHVKVKERDGGTKTASVSSYNAVDYAASNFKQQIPNWKGVIDIANIPSSVSGKAFAENPKKKGLRDSDPENYPNLRQYDPNIDIDDVNFGHIVKEVDGEVLPFVGYHSNKRLYRVSGNACVLEEEPNGRINYTVNVPASGKYKVVALTSYSWYTQTKLGGYINGTKFQIGGDLLPEWYPFVMKGSHWYEIGSFSFDKGANSISVHGELSDPKTPIYGFVVCEDFDQNYSGGILSVNANIQPMIMKDGTKAEVPSRLALAAKMLRRDARPALLWDDEFRTYGEEAEISSQTYYRKVEKGRREEGAGTNIGENENGNAVCYSDPQDVGFTKGTWQQKDGRLHFNSEDSGQLILSKQWSVNLSIEATIRLTRGSQAGIRFFAQKEGASNDGYLFIVDFDRGVRELILEESGKRTVVASQAIGNVEIGQAYVVKAILHKGKGLFYVGGVQAFKAGSGNPVEHNGSVNTSTGEVDLARKSGACGIYANNAELFCSHLGISTTDRWETLEKFAVTVDGTTKEFGRIRRTGYDFDEFGYLIYSGLNEREIRDNVEGIDWNYMLDSKGNRRKNSDGSFMIENYNEQGGVSLDYEIQVFDWASWEGGKEITITLLDAGVWFGELLVGDKEGMSVIWAGDAWSFLDAMNMAVNDYGAKGIGLWTMGQEDPTLFELVPDVVPKNK